MTDQTTTSNATPVTSPEGHDAEMIAKAEAAQAPKPSEQPTPQRPEGLPEKFGSWEDMAKAYAELERKQSTGTQENPEAEAGETPATPETPEAAQAQVEAAGMDYAALTEEYNSTGTLSEKTYEALAKVGFPKEAVDAYIAGQEAIAERSINEIKGEVGGAEEYAKMIEWAGANLSKEDITAFDKMMDASDTRSIKLAIAGLHAKYTAANGSEPALLNGGNGDVQNDVFRSTHELTEAMSDPRYAKDAAYRADVAAKAGRSNIF